MHSVSTHPHVVFVRDDFLPSRHLKPRLGLRWQHHWLLDCVWVGNVTHLEGMYVALRQSAGIVKKVHKDDGFWLSTVVA